MTVVVSFQPYSLETHAVWMSDRKEKASAVEQVAPRSYEVETSSGSYRRNWRDLISLRQSTSFNPYRTIVMNL